MLWTCIQSNISETWLTYVELNGIGRSAERGCHRSSKTLAQIAMSVKQHVFPPTLLFIFYIVVILYILMIFVT